MSANTYNAGVAARAKTNAAAMAAAKQAKSAFHALGDFVIGFVRGDAAPTKAPRKAAPKKPAAKKPAAKPAAKKPVAKPAAKKPVAKTTARRTK